MWKCYKIKFKAKSLIHIGNGLKLGIINRTWYYIPGKTIWGAVTAILARKMMNNYSPEIYKDVGNFVRKHMIFSYFYPLKVKEEKKEKDEVLFPNYTEEGLGFGRKGDKFLMSKEEFEREFITSYVATAIDKTSKTAEDGSLHEFELISSVEFIGYLFTDVKEKEDYNENKTRISIDKLEKGNIIIKIENKEGEIFNTIKNIQVGGERNYGFGWLELQDPSVELDHVNIYGSDVFVDLNDLTLNSDKFLALAHVNTKNLELNEIKGDLEPVIGRKWDDKKGAGQNVSNAKICLTPGTKFKSNSKIKICDFGMWTC